MIKKETRNGNDTSNLESLLSQAEEVQTVFESCGGLTWEELDSYRQQLHGEGSIQNELNVYRCWDELKWLEKDQERMEKDQERTEEHLNEVMEFADSEWKDKIEDYLDNMERLAEIKEERKEIMEDAQCKVWTEEYFDEQMDLEDLRFEEEDLYMETGDFWWEFEDMQNLMWANKMFEDILEEIAYAREHEYPNLPDELKARFDEMAEVAETLVEKGQACSVEGNHKCMKEIQHRLDELGRKAGKLFRHQDDFSSLGIDDMANKNLKKSFEGSNFGEAAEVIEYFLSLDPSLINKISDEVILDKLSRVMGRAPQGFMEKTGDLMDAFANANSADSSLGQYKEQILGHNYFGDALDSLIAALEEVQSGTMTISELLAQVETLKEQSKRSEVSMGVSKFGDATSDTWFYEAAHYDDFNIQGKNGQFDAKGATSYAEMLKVLAEAMGIGQSAGEPGYGPAANHWAKGYYKAIEHKAVTLMDPNHKITRGEMARLMVELLGLPSQGGSTPFTDLSGNPHADYIATLYNYGVISGDSGGTTVRPYDTINRAEAFTMAKNAMDELQFAMEGSDVDSLLEDLDDLEDSNSNDNLMNNVMGAWKYVE